MFPIKSVEEAVRLDVGYAILETTLPLSEIGDEKVLNKAPGVLVKETRELELAIDDPLVDVLRVLVIEGIDASQHLLDEDAYGPPVDSLAVSLAQQNLRCQLLWGTALRLGAPLHLLSEAKVRQFELAVGADQDVLRLQVSLDYVLAVQVLEDQDDVSALEARGADVQPAYVTQLVEQLSTANEFDHEVDLATVRRVSVQTDNKRVVDDRHYIHLVADVVHLLQPQYVCLL